MGLQITWFVLVAVLFFGYFVLEGFDSVSYTHLTLPTICSV